MGTWGNIGIGILAIVCGIVVIVAEANTSPGFMPGAILGWVMVAAGLLLLTIGVIAAGVRLGSRR